MKTVYISVWYLIVLSSTYVGAMEQHKTPEMAALSSPVDKRDRQDEVVSITHKDNAAAFLDISDEHWKKVGIFGSGAAVIIAGSVGAGIIIKTLWSYLRRTRPEGESQEGWLDDLTEFIQGLSQKHENFNAQWSQCKDTVWDNPHALLEHNGIVEMLDDNGKKALLKIFEKWADVFCMRELLSLLAEDQKDLLPILAQNPQALFSESHRGRLNAVQLDRISELFNKMDGWRTQRENKLSSLFGIIENKWVSPFLKLVLALQSNDEDSSFENLIDNVLEDVLSDPYMLLVLTDDDQEFKYVDVLRQLSAQQFDDLNDILEDYTDTFLRTRVEAIFGDEASAVLYKISALSQHFLNQCDDSNKSALLLLYRQIHQQRELQKKFEAFKDKVSD